MEMKMENRLLNCVFFIGRMAFFFPLIFWNVHCQHLDKPVSEKTKTMTIRDTLLANIKTTGRISSNHFCEIVADENGNIFMATFKKIDQGNDEICIMKIAPSGKIIWELGKENIGRATAISIDPNGNVWVVGLFTEQLQLGNCSIQVSSGSEMFLAQISPEGGCNRLWNFKGATPFNIQINNKDEILIAGDVGDEIIFENTVLKNKDKAKSFVAKFNLQGTFKWIKPLNADIQRIKSDSEGNFYVTGSFTAHMNFNNKTLTTTGSFDKDGFVLKIGNHKNDNWIKQFGSPGIIRKGYRTSEGGDDLSINKINEIYVLASLQDKQNDHSPYHLFLLEYDQNGRLVDSVLVANHIAYRGASTLSHDQQGDLWISSTAENVTTINGKDYAFGKERQSFLIKCNREKKIEEVVFPKHKKNMAFRSATHGREQIIFSGHYQDSLSIYNQTITNDGNHGIFLFLKKTINHKE